METIELIAATAIVRWNALQRFSAIATSFEMLIGETFCCSIRRHDRQFCSEIFAMRIPFSAGRVF